ncbi:hypothetical protein B9Z55_022094 [Caenorhabditis nigoni]|uniref:CCHC-type domain-containing protein n=1 Tax=Caenorhabditis nigoni TaxID=1611254 RepID=A0A2G5TUX3_9PELO|nr:hypothetical protein B9Z55_022094 [Caenorhabditis nigoni]
MSSSNHSNVTFHRKEDGASSHSFQQARKVLTPFTGEESQYQRFRSSYQKLILDQDYHMEWKRTVLEDNLTGSATKFKSNLNDAEEAIKATLDKLDRRYLKHTSIEEIRNAFDSITLNTGNIDDFESKLIKLENAYDKLKEAKVVLDSRAAIQLMGRMPNKVRRDCYEEQMRGTLTVDYVIAKADAFCSYHLNDRVTTRAASFLSAKTGQTTSTVKLNHMSMITDSEDEFEENEEKSKEADIMIATTTRQETTKTEKDQKPEQKAPLKSLFRDNGTPDCPNRDTGPQLKYEDAIKITIENAAQANAFRLGNGPSLGRLRFTFCRDTEDPQQKCNACRGGHRLLQCPKSSSNIRNWLHDNKRCVRCGSPFHQYRDCSSTSTCFFCDGKHVSAGCKMKEYYRDTRNYPKEARKPDNCKFFRTQNPQ